MNRSFAFIRTLIIIFVLLASMVPSWFPAVSIDQSIIDHDNAVIASVDDVETPPENELPRSPAPQVTNWSGGCALSITLQAYADDPNDPNDYPTQFYSTLPTNSSGFSGHGFFDVKYPIVANPSNTDYPGGQGGQVAVGDDLVAYVAIQNVAETRCTAESTGPIDVSLQGFILRIGTTDYDVYNSIQWSDGTPGVLGPLETAFLLVPYEVQADDVAFVFTSTATSQCADIGAANCPTPALVNEVTTYPIAGVRTLDGAGSAFNNQTYGQIYGTLPASLDIDVVGPRATVLVTANGSTEPITVVPFAGVTYEITLTSIASGVDAIASIDSVEALGEVIPECSTSDTVGNGVGWFINDVEVNVADLTSDPIASGETAVCRFARSMDPVIINDVLSNTFTLTGDIQISNGANLGGQVGNIHIEAPEVLIAEADITVVKEVISPPGGQPVRVGDVVQYAITVINSGNTELGNLRFIDSLIGVVPSPISQLDIGEEREFTVSYEVDENAPNPLLNTISVEAQVVGAPPGFTVRDSAAASLELLQDEVIVTLFVDEVDGVPFDVDNRATYPRPGSTIRYLVQYCNQTDGFLRDLRYVNNTPTYVQLPRPTFVDSVLQDGQFDVGCFVPDSTAFTYTVPDVTDSDFSDPVINRIRVQAITAGGEFVFAESTATTNVLSDTIEINAVRYSNITGEELDDSDAALRGEVVYYHLDIENRSGTAVCDVVVRHYVRSTTGTLLPGSPFIIQDNFLEWNSGVAGRLDPDDGVDGSGDDSATSRTVITPTISFVIQGDTPDPLYRVFEVEATTDCSGTPLASTFLDRAAVYTDLSNVQLNNLVEVYSADAGGNIISDALDFGLLLDGQRYVFRYSSTNVGAGFTITSLRYCVITNGSCLEDDFPSDSENFFSIDDNEFQPFQTRTDRSRLIEIEGDEQTPIQILITLEGREGANNLTIRVLKSFLLLSPDIPGEIVDGPEELVRGDGPVRYEYAFINETGGSLQKVIVFNLLERGTELIPGVYEPIPFPGFPTDVYYEVCEAVDGVVLADQSIQGTCNFTFRSYLPQGGFDFQALLVAERTIDLQPVIGAAAISIEEQEHLTAEKEVGDLTPISQPARFTISITNNSDYQPVQFPDTGFTDLLEPPVIGAVTPLLSDFFGFEEPFGDPSPVRTLAPGGTATVLFDVLATPDISSLTNTVTFVGETLPNPDAALGESEAGRSVAATATAVTQYVCPIVFYGFFLAPGDSGYPGPITNEDTDGVFTTGEGRWAELFYANIGTEPLFLTGVLDGVFVRENGRSLDFNSDVSWPTADEGVLPPGEAFSYQTPIWLRPTDLVDQQGEPITAGVIEFTWNATINLGANAGLGIEIPEGCQQFDIEWFFLYPHPLPTTKSRIDSNGLIFPGDTIQYDIDIQNINEHVPFIVQNVNDSLLSPSVVMQYGNGTTGVTGRLEPFPLDGSDIGVSQASMRNDGLQDVYTATALDLGQAIANLATVTFYIPSTIPAENVPPSWDSSVYGSGSPMLATAGVTVPVGSPLRLRLEPSVEEVPVGGIFDIAVLINNISADFRVDDILITSPDAQFLQGLAFAGYPNVAGLDLDVNSSASFTIATPFFQIPTDYVGDTYEICAIATGTLSDVGASEVTAEACAEVTVLPADLVIEKSVHPDDQCLGVMPDVNADGKPEVEILNPVWFRVRIANESSVNNFYGQFDLTDELSTGQTIDLQTRFEDAVLAKYGEIEYLAPGMFVILCIPYTVQSAAIDLPTFENVITAEVFVTQDPVSGEGSTLTIDETLEMEAVDANLQITKSAPQNVAFPGDEVIYTISIFNRNTDGYVLVLRDVYDTLLSGQLPGEPSYVDTCLAEWDTGEDLGLSPSCDPSVTSIPFDDPRWVWPLADTLGNPIPGVIPSGETATFTYSYEIQPEDPDPLLNIVGADALIFDNGDEPITNPTNEWLPILDSDGVTPLVPRDTAGLALAVTDSQLLVRKAATASSALVGSQVTYSITVTNIGEEPVSNIRVIDCYPLAVTPCDFNEVPFTAAFGGVDLTSRLAPAVDQTRLDPFESVFVSNYVLTMPTAPQLNADPTLDPYINTAFATGTVDVGGGMTEELNPSSDSAVVDLLVPGIFVIKRTLDNVGSAVVGDTVTYEIEIRNTGDTDILLDSVQDVVPGGPSGTPIDIPEFNVGTCEDGTGAPTFDVGTDLLAPYDPEAPTPVFLCKRIDIVITLPPGGSEFINTVRVSGTSQPGGETLTDGASAVIDVRVFGVVVEKQAIELSTSTPINSVEDGEQYRYRITVQNGGIVSLQELRISDPLLNGGVAVIISGVDAFGPGDVNNNDLLDPGESFTYDYTYTADYARDTENGALAGLVNTVTVIGVDAEGELTPARTASDTITIEPAQLDVTKLACREIGGLQPTFPDCVVPTTFAQPGDFVWYQVTVSNPSNRQVDSVVITDNLEGTLTGGNWTGGVPGVLPACSAEPCPTGVITYRGSAAIPAGVNSVDNTVDVTAVAGETDIQAQATASVAVVTGDLLVTVVERNGRTEAIAGTNLIFDVTVTNVSADTAIDNIQLTLPLINGTPRNIGTLTAGDAQTEVYNYTVVASDNTLDFEAFANGTLQGTGLPVTDSDTWRVVRVVNGVSVTKTADREFVAVGDTVNYTITIENTGSQVISELAVQDSFIGNPANGCTPAVSFPSTINPSEIVTRSYSCQITGGQGNPVVNTLVVTGEFGVTPFVVETEWTIFIVGGPSGEILVTNEPTRDTVTAGDTVAFNYQICNLSDVEMTGVTLTDEDGALTLPSGTLQPDQCYFATRTVATTEGDIPAISRSVTGEGNVAGVGDLSQTVERTVEVVGISAGDLEFEVVAVPDDYVTITTPTQSLELTFIIRNNGTLPITITGFTDSRPWYTSFTPNPVGRPVNPGEPLTVSGNVLAGGGTGDIPVTDTTPDPIAGTWTVTATDGSNTFTASDSISIPVLSTPGATLAVNYSADPSPAMPGDTITYTFTVTNITGGSVTAQLEVTADECETFTPDSSTLWEAAGLAIAGGTSVDVTATCVVPDPFDEPAMNLVAEVFDLASAGTPQDTSDVATPIQQPTPSLDVEVIGSLPATLQVGSEAELVYRVSNTTTTGSITDISLSFTPTCASGDRLYYEDVDGDVETTFNGTLAANTTIYVFCPYTPDEDDLDGLDVSITATATGGLMDVDTTTLDVIDVEFSVAVTGSLAQSGESFADVGETVDFTIVITNEGNSTLELPPYSASNPPLSTTLRNVGTGQTMAATLGDTQTIYNFMASGDAACNFPLEPDETCTITEADFSDTTTLRYAATATSPADILVTVSVFLQEATTDAATPAATDTWTVNVAVELGAMEFTDLSFTPSTLQSGQQAIFTWPLINDGSILLTLTSVQFSLVQVATTQAIGADGIVLTDYSRQGTVCAQGTMSLTSQSGVSLSTPYPFPVGQTINTTYTFSYTGQTGCSGTLEARVTATANYTLDGLQTVTATDTYRLPASFLSGTGGTDPDGNALDPNQLDPDVTKTVSPEEGAGPGDSVTFTVNVTNGGTSNMNITLIDGVPTAFEIQSVTSTIGTPSTDGQEVTLVTTLTPGQRATIQIVAMIGATVEVPSLFTNTACAASGSRSAICATVEVPIGAVGTGEGGTLPATGIGPLVEPISTQGLSGEAGFPAMLMLVVSLFLMMNIAGVIRPRWIIIGAVVMIGVVILAGALIFGGGDNTEEKKTDDSTAVVVDNSNLPPIGGNTLQPDTVGGTPVPPTDPTNTPGPGTPTSLPLFPTLLPSPTPYSVEWSGRVRIDIPKLDFIRPIPVVPLPLENNTWDVTSLGYNVGWLEETTWLESDWGNTVLVAHVQLDVEQPGPFYYLFLLDEGDEIIIYEGQEAYRYEVIEIMRVEDTAIEVTYPTLDPILTLMTCTNWDEARGVFAERRIVRAVPVGTTLPADDTTDAPSQSG